MKPTLTTGLLNHQQDSFQLSDVVQQLLLQPLKLACALLQQGMVPIAESKQAL